MRAWRHRASCRDPGIAAGWVATIARREALRRAIARADISGEPSAAEPDPGALEEIEVTAFRVDVERVVGVLSRDEQRLLELRYRSDLTQRGVAAALGLPEGTVKVRLHRLRKVLEERLR